MSVGGTKIQIGGMDLNIVTTIASDVVIILSDVKDTGSDLLDIRSDIVTVQSDLSDVWSDLKIVQSDVKVIDTRVATIRSDLIITQSDIKDISPEVDQIQSDLIITQSDVIVIQNNTAKTFVTTIDLHQGAATYTLATGTAQAVTVESVVFSPRVNVSDDVGGITSISIQTNHTTAQTFISSAEGAIANLTAEAQLAWTGRVLLQTGKLIQLTLNGGTADADPTTCDVIIQYRANANGGYLA